MTTISSSPPSLNGAADPPHPADQLAIYAAAVYEPHDVVELRLIRPGAARSHWTTAERLVDAADQLAAANRDGWNVVAGVNPRMGHRGRGNAAVQLARVVVADHDDATIDAVRTRLSATGMPSPTLIINSGHGGHSYFRLASPMPAEHWPTWQRDLAALLGSDSTISNPERVMRLPGFQNCKREPAVPCCIVECDPLRVYDLADVADLIPMRPGSDTPAPVFRFVRHATDAGGGDRVERCRRYLAKCPPAIAGQRGHRTTWHAANTCNRLGLTKAEALDVMNWYSAAKCDPPWSDREINHKISDAYGRNAGQHGSKLREARATSPVFAVRRIVGAA